MNKNSRFRFQVSNLKVQVNAIGLFPFAHWALMLMLFLSCNKETSDTKGDNRSAKFKQYYVQGQQLYLVHCSNCHQENGSGLGRVYPPVNVSDYMEANFPAVICLIRYGKAGEITVNGNTYVQAMPGVPTLTDLEIAEIATYIYNTWDHQRGIVEVKKVSKTLDSCKNSEVL